MSLNDSKLIEVIANRLVAAETLLANVSKQEGPRGEVGPQGIQGEVGPQGAKGEVGPQGAKGEVGRQGEVGPQGAQGEVGPQGDGGPQGIQGATGPHGVSGATGEQGPKGDTGPAPDHKWEGTKLRFQKPDGKWGKAVDLKGEKGADGKGRVIVAGGRSSGGGMGDLLPGNETTEPTGIAVQQGGQWVNLSWPAFISTIAGAVDMGVELSRRSDFVGDTAIYRGEAAPGASESAAVWRIKRIDFVSGGDGKQDVNEKWAGGNANYDKVWADRASLEYS